MSTYSTGNIPRGSFFLFLFFTSTLTRAAIAEDYQCDVDGDKRLGLVDTVAILREYSGQLAQPATAVLDCGEAEFAINGSGQLDVDAKTYLLCKMNEIRSQVALGYVDDDGTYGTYPVATNMQRMRWNDELAEVAQNYASNCNYSHNINRESHYAALTGLTSPQVGENIAAYGISWTIDSEAAVQAIETALSSWNGENKDWYYDSINDDSWAAGIGHFTQNIWAETTMVGCGQAWCPNGYPGNSSFNMIFTVCNFYIAGNWWGSHPYNSGQEVCSTEISSGDRCENGLITPADYTDGLPYLCDTNGDEELGLEEIIDSLQTLTESVN